MTCPVCQMVTAHNHPEDAVVDGFVIGHGWAVTSLIAMAGPSLDAATTQELAETTDRVTTDADAQEEAVAEMTQRLANDICEHHSKMIAERMRQIVSGYSEASVKRH